MGLSPARIFIINPQGKPLLAYKVTVAVVAASCAMHALMQVMSEALQGAYACELFGMMHSMAQDLLCACRAAAQGLLSGVHVHMVLPGGHQRLPPA